MKRGDYMLEMPVYYDYQNVIDSIIQPSTIHIHNTALARFFKRYLLQQAISVFEFDIPKNWDKDYFVYNLFCRGFMCVINTDKFGIIPQHCTLSGYGVFYQPIEALVTNPLIRGLKRLRIGRATELIKLQHDYGGVLDLVNYYGDMMALCAEGAGINILNSKLAYLFATDSKAGAESIKKIFDRVQKSETCVVYDKSLLDDNGDIKLTMFNQNIQQTYIADKILADLRKIKNEFLTTIGINNANTDKKERLISDEVNANDVEVYSLCTQWLEVLRESFEKVNAMFGLNLSVKLRFESEVKANDGETFSDRVV